MRRKLSLSPVVLSCLTSILTACQGEGGNESGGGGERASYLLVSSSLGYTAPSDQGTLQSSLTVTEGLVPCTVAGTEGLCLTPTAARGKVVSLSLGQSNPGPPARLFGTGEGLNRDGAISLAEFDLADPQGIPGEGNLQDSGPGATFTLVNTLIGYMDAQFTLEGTFWTVRFAFYPQPIAEDPAVAMCVDAPRLQTIAQNPGFVEGSPDFARGDVMYCEKTAADEECAGSDFTWLDATTNQLASARPATPRQLGFIAANGVQCLLHPEGPTEANFYQPGELRFNGFNMTSRLTTPVAAGARFEGCNKIFTTRDSTGAPVEGTSLTATLNYDLSGLVFFPGVTDAAAATVEELLAVATLRPIHAREILGEGPAAAEYSSITMTIALGQEPLADCGGGDPSDGTSPGSGAPADGSLPMDGNGPAGSAGPATQ